MGKAKGKTASKKQKHEIEADAEQQQPEQMDAEQAATNGKLQQDDEGIPSDRPVRVYADGAQQDRTYRLIAYDAGAGADRQAWSCFLQAFSTCSTLGTPRHWSKQRSCE